MLSTVIFEKPAFYREKQYQKGEKLLIEKEAALPLVALKLVKFDESTPEVAASDKTVQNSKRDIKRLDK